MMHANVLKYLGVNKSMIPKYIERGKLTPVPVSTPNRKHNQRTIIYITKEVVAIKRELEASGHTGQRGGRSRKNMSGLQRTAGGD